VLLPLWETCLDPSWPPTHHISAAAKFTGRLPPTRFPASPVESGPVGGTSGCVAYVRLDFVEDTPSLLSLFLELARLTTIWPGLQLLPWNKAMAICLRPLGGDFVGAVSSGTQFIVPNCLCSSLHIAQLPYFAPVPAARYKNVFFLCLSPVD